MNFLRLSTQFHKWLALVVGLQVLFWVAGGLVMTAIPIERVRSENRLQPLTLAPLDPAATAQLPFLVAQAPLAKAELKSTSRGPVWVLTPVEGEPRTVSAATGEPLPAMTPNEARTAAVAAYKGPGQPVAVRLLDPAPKETGREGPIWRVSFDDPEKTDFYLSPETGEVVTRRSGVWRFYDFFWRLHVMDWNDGEHFNHPLIVIVTFLTLIIVLSGFVLLWVRLARDYKGWKAKRRT